MKEDAGGRCQRAVMATDAEWERIGRAAAARGMELSRYVVRRALERDDLAPEVVRRAVRELLVLSRLPSGRSTAPPARTTEIRSATTTTATTCSGPSRP